MGQFHFGQTDLESLRYPGYGLTAKADYTSDWLGASLAAGYQTEVKGWLFSPSLGLNYLNWRTPDVTEYGAGTLNYHLAGKNADNLEVEARLDVNKHIDTALGLVSPRFSLGLGVETLDPQATFRTSFAQVPGIPGFDTETPDLGRLRASIGVGADLKLNENASAFIDYQGSAQKHYQNHTGTLGLKISW